MRYFAGKRVWITGASAGIGEALAVALAAAGARLVLSARRADQLERVAARCRDVAPSVEPDAGAIDVDATPRDATPLAPMLEPLDLAEPAQLAHSAARVLAAGPVDILLHNAGISQRALALDTSLEVDRRLLQTNYLGTVALTKLVAPSMVARKRGHLVVVTSLTGEFGTPYRSSYAASKHALHGFFDSLRAELHAEGIAVTLLCPGFVRTGISENALTGDGRPLSTMDAATARGLAPEVFARRALAAVARRRQQVHIGGREVVGVYLKRFAPRLFAALIRRAAVR